MKIVFNLELEDLIIYQKKIRTFYPDFIHLRLLQSIFGPATILFFIYIATNDNYGLLLLYIMFLPAIFLGLYLWKYSPALWMKSNLNMAYEKGKLNGILGNNTIITEEKGLIEINGAYEKLTFWNHFIKTHKSECHFFCIDKLQNCIIIPKNKIVEGDFDTFTDEILKKIQ